MLHQIRYFSIKISFHHKTYALKKNDSINDRIEKSKVNKVKSKNSITFQMSMQFDITFRGN